MDVYQHILSGQVAGHVYAMSLHSIVSFPPVPDPHAVWLSAVTALWDGSSPPSTSYGQLVPPEGVPTIATTYVIASGQRKKVMIGRTNVTLVGTASGQRMPPFVCAVMNLSSEETSKHANGRIWQPPMTITHLTSGGIDSTAMNIILNNWAFAFGALNAGGLEKVIYNRGLMQTTSVTSINIRSLWSAQRRRQDRATFTRLHLP